MEVLGTHLVIADYKKKSENELTLKTGDFVEVFMRGEHVWYGCIDNTKGFFPARVVQVEQRTSKDNKGVANEDNSKKVSNNSSNVIEFQFFDETNLLDDNHKTRTRSKARSPSYIFLKNSILVKNDSLENCSYEWENEEEFVLASEETMQKHNFKQASQKETITGETSCDQPDWIKTLNSKSKSFNANTPLKEKDDSNKMPPWMEEVRKRRESKGSTYFNECLVTQTVSKINTVSSSKVTVSQNQKVYQSDTQAVSVSRKLTSQDAPYSDISEVKNIKSTTAQYKSDEKPQTPPTSVPSSTAAETILTESKVKQVDVFNTVPVKVSNENLCRKATEDLIKPKSFEGNSSGNSTSETKITQTDKQVKSSSGIESISQLENLTNFIIPTTNQDDIKTFQLPVSPIKIKSLQLSDTQAPETISKTREKEVQVEKIDSSKVKLIMQTLDEFETKYQEQTVHIQQELDKIHEQVQNQREDVKLLITQMKTQLENIFDLK